MYEGRDIDLFFVVGDDVFGNNFVFGYLVIVVVFVVMFVVIVESFIEFVFLCCFYV